jgi:YfiH family protein
VVRRIDGPQQGVIEGVDAVMTDVPQLCIGVSTADCIPVLLYDSTHRAISAVHAGWRGTVLRIVQKAVETMRDTYGTAPADLQAVIGPGISLDSFEVGDEVYDQFLSAGFDMQPISRREAKWHIDLPMCNRLQLMEAGIPSNNIQMTNICTYQQYDRYFSARRLGIQSGRIYTGILIK